MAPNKLLISPDARYKKLLEEFHALQRELEEEKRQRNQAEMKVRALEAEASLPEHLRLDRLESEIKKTKTRSRGKTRNKS